MRRIGLLLAFLTAFSGVAMAQVSVNLSRNHFNIAETLTVTITNDSDEPISVCAGGLWRGADNADPYADYEPLVAKKWDGKRWAVVLPDADKSYLSYTLKNETLEPKAVKELRVRFKNAGRMQLELLYLRGSGKKACESRRHWKIADSCAFTIE